MQKATFHCIDAHTCGNPVRLVVSGHPPLIGETMSQRRQHFLKDYDWIRRSLMFEPRGHDMMSGSFLYPPTNADSDAAVLFIETSGCLPMCGHGTIGTVTAAIEYGFLTAKTPGTLLLDVPAGQIKLEYYQNDRGKVEWVKLFNVDSFVSHRNIEVEIPELGVLEVDIAYGGNFYAIIEPQKNYSGLKQFGAANILRWSPIIRSCLNEIVSCVHPLDSSVFGVSHVLWTGQPESSKASAANAVFYGDKAIDRSPCGTGTSARMAHLFDKGELKLGQEFIHESFIGSHFIGRVEALTSIAGMQAIKPSIQGWARVTGHNTIFVDPEDPYCLGFSVV